MTKELIEVSAAKHSGQEELISSLARKHGVSVNTIRDLYAALIAGSGYQAQFNLPELGGMGQWSNGGMVMVGDMFNHGLKAKVADLCSELADVARQEAYDERGSRHGPKLSSGWYPRDLGMPASSGSQNSMRYAFFPSARRLAISDGDHTTVYDTADHQISGFSQQQGGSHDVSFTSQHGRVALSTLRRVRQAPNADESHGDSDDKEPRRQPPEPPPSPMPGIAKDDVISKIERLGALHAKGILTDEEFQTKKAELLSRI
ncbi:hypothetical protein J2W42_006803 [Rhizobium tibeticum]|uniref:SHOCT domain-containing protein n=1 Tax=Rhizobium tibeticum TaxID=501024 RepID=UPI002781C07F|nr:SHOCT domain-containing protein [Rhizobium tibeticum]MDP9813926.1 hypothetical protein [Rhizobium tibeticum]